MKKYYKYIGILIVLALWEVLPKTNIISSAYFPSLSSVIFEMISLNKDNYLYMNVMVSVWRITNGLLIAILVSTTLTLILGFFFKKFTEKLVPLFRIFSQINPYSLMPLFIVFLGIGEPAKIGIIIWTSFCPIIFNTLQGIDNIDPILLKTANSMTDNKFQIFFKVALPSCIPYIFEGIRGAVQMAFLILTSSEMTGSTAGLGYIIHNSGMNFFVPRLYGAGLIIVIISVFINLFFVDLKNRLLFWKNSSEKNIKKISKVQIISAILVLLFIFVQGSVQVKKAQDYQNDPRNGFGTVE